MTTKGTSFRADITPAHFSPFGNFEYDLTHKELFNEDLVTGDRYHVDHSLRKKCLQLAFFSPFYIVQLALVTVMRVIKLVTLSHFWLPKKEEKESSLSGRVSAFTGDLLKVITAPLAAAVRTVAAVYGTINIFSLTAPLDARKVIASVERAQDCIMIRRFQPVSNAWATQETEMTPVAD